ncbi:acyltransferase family protein [Paludisphaera mucosa]|uniref:Acyltransferase n=1 Tax=Paludisphaera mucosa TaxID=3030827 RepID=A0ABT6F430_9BACT|nr:acyltransferase [Paludisphaera mucosa]MDG3002279.1 acyltransferase [Paludisphaera mucosa]
MDARSTLDRPEGDRDNAVGLVRFVLTSLVVLSHSLHMYGRSLANDPMVLLTSGQYTLGRTSVDAFFILSGFLVARSWGSSRGWADFVARRAYRVYPGFFAAVAFSSLVAAPWLAARGVPRPAVPSWSDLVLPALVLDFRELGVNGSLWTIRYDFYYYGLIGLLGSAGWIARRWPIMAIWAASWAVYAAWFVSGVEAGVEAQHPRLLTCFLSGVVFYAYRDRIPLSWGWFAVAAAGLAGYGGGWWPYEIWPYRVMSLTFPLYGAYVLLFAAFRPGARAAKLAWLGDYSYGLYLYACPIQIMLLVAFRPQLNPFTHFLTAWALAGVFAHLSLRLIERPALRLRRRSSPNGRAIPPPHFRIGALARAETEATA